jgi:hypothetical protein
VTNAWSSHGLRDTRTSWTITRWAPKSPVSRPAAARGPPGMPSSARPPWRAHVSATSTPFSAISARTSAGRTFQVRYGRRGAGDGWAAAWELSLASAPAPAPAGVGRAVGTGVALGSGTGDGLGGRDGAPRGGRKPRFDHAATR